MRWRGRILLCTVLCVAGCHRNRDESLGVVGAEVGVLDVAHLDKPDVLVAALRLSGADRDRALGAHRRVILQKLHIEPAGKPAEDLVLASTVDSDGKSAVHLVEDTGRTSGMEAVVTGGLLTVKPKDGQFVRRRPEPGEVERLRRTVEEPLAASLELLQPFVAVTAAGEVAVGARKGQKLTLSRAEKGTIAVETEPGRKWRESVEVDKLDGEVVLDAHGALLSSRLDAVYHFRRDALAVKVTLSHVESLEAAQEIAAPPSVPIPQRPRPMLDRQTLLDGIAPPRREISALH